MKLRIDAVPYWERIPHGQLSEDATLVLEACQALRMSRDQDNTTIDHGILSATAKTLVGSLSNTSYATLLKLSLITWHFDSSGAPSDELACFLRQPSHNAVWKVWETIHDDYQRIMQRTVPFGEFKATHDFLLCPLPGSVSNGV